MLGVIGIMILVGIISVFIVNQQTKCTDHSVVRFPISDSTDPRASEVKLEGILKRFSSDTASYIMNDPQYFVDGKGIYARENEQALLSEYVGKRVILTGKNDRPFPLEGRTSVDFRLTSIACK